MTVQRWQHAGQTFQTCRQARRYMAALMSGLTACKAWEIAGASVAQGDAEGILGKGESGLDESQARLYHAIERHTVLACAVLAACAVTAALLGDRTDTQAQPPTRSGQPPPADPGLIPLTVLRIREILAEALVRPGRRTMPSKGTNGPAGTKPAPAGSTNAQDSPATPTSPWSASQVRLPYYVYKSIYRRLREAGLLFGSGL